MKAFANEVIRVDRRVNRVEKPEPMGAFRRGLWPVEISWLRGKHPIPSTYRKGV
jgi:hypothetical protein